MCRIFLLLKSLLVACLCNRILLIDVSTSVALVIALGKCVANAEEPGGGKLSLAHDGYVDEIGKEWLVGIWKVTSGNELSFKCHC